MEAITNNSRMYTANMYRNFTKQVILTVSYFGFSLET